MKNRFRLSYLPLILILPGFAAYHCAAQERPAAPPPRDSVIIAAREIMTAQTYCALITLDSTGQPHARTMNPFPPDDSMNVWIATNTRTRKAHEIKNDSRVCLYYADHGKATGYVSLTGKATLTQDQQEIRKRYREYWKQAFPDEKYLVLIKVVPERVEVINYKRGMLNGELTWKAPSVEFARP